METYRNASLSLERRAADLLSRMTIEEKAAQICSESWEGPAWNAETGELSAEARESLKTGVGVIGRPTYDKSPADGARYTNAIQKFLMEETRLGIPALFHEEALHGLMAKGATIFPQSIGLGSTWDPELVEKVYAAAAIEMRSRGSNNALTPDLDLGREPRWGRIEETFGEDPYLVSRMGVAAVGGLQGKEQAVDEQHVLATAKHYTAHGQPDGGRNCAPVNVSRRLLYEQFLKPFEAAVREAGVGAIMASYNEIDGIPTHANPWLLRDVLRGEWGFDGLVISDGGGIPMLENTHHVAADLQEAARLALLSGVQLEIPDMGAFRKLSDQVSAGKVDEAQLDEACAAVLRAKFRLGLFERPYVDPERAAQINKSAEHRQLAYEAACKSMVLLKNEGGLLPLQPGQIRRIAVIGPNAADLHLGGYSEGSDGGITFLEGVQVAAEKSGMEVLYAEGSRITEAPRDWRGWWVDEGVPSNLAGDDERIAEAVRITDLADVVILVLGENESVCREAWSEEHLGDRDSLDLPGRQQELADLILDTGKPVIVVLVNGRPLTIQRLAERAPAILECWYLGLEGGRAFADVLFGAVNPGGKLPVTFPRSVGQLPAYYYQKPSANRSYLMAENGPLFPFGFGLSYTTFELKNVQVTPEEIRPDGQALVSVEVTNTGERAGDEVVQVYIRDVVSSATRPVKELKAFRRVSLEPGEMKRVEFTLGSEALQFLDVHMRWAVEPGEFEVMVGRSSVDFHCCRLRVGG